MRWLNVDDLSAVEPDPRLFPPSTISCGVPLHRDRMFPAERADARPQCARAVMAIHLLNDRLARHTRKGVFGPQFRKVRLEDPNR